jgi:hypothetical protein
MSDTPEDADPEELLQQSKDQSRHTSEPTQQSTDAGVDRVDAIKEALVAIEEGDAPENINIRDANMKALLVGLRDAGELDSVAETLAAELDDQVETAEVSQSDVARLLMRIGLREALPGVYEDAEEAAKQKAVEQATGY